ncbi:MAG: aminoacyl-tRNA hydrolase [Oscillospiraceae bacterium]|nr:aminoacyl-tRNA hydrolase [Oscillospiraceae bacterium]
MFFKSKGGSVDAIIVGLGNPGIKYNTTRHNVGFMAIDFILDKLNIKADKQKFDANYVKCEIDGKSVIILKPLTFMNLSGDSIFKAASFFKVPAENIIIIYDDVLLDVGKMRIRRKGSDGGHNGIKSIIARLHADSFPRIKIGVGKKPHPDYDLADWVLSPLPLKDREIINDNMDKVFDAVKLILNGNTDEAMNRYN